MSQLILRENAVSPSTPSTGDIALFAKTNGRIYIKDDAGTETPLGAGDATELSGQPASFYLDRENHTGRKPALFKYQDTDVVVASGTTYQGYDFTGDAQAILNDGFTLASDLTALTAGLWIIGARATWNNTSGGNFGIRIFDALALGDMYPSSAENVLQPGSLDVSVSATVYVPDSVSVGVSYFQASGSDKTLSRMEFWAYQIW